MMLLVNRWTAVLALLLSACGSSEVPLPSIVSVEPRGMSTNESILLAVELDRPLPPRLDYGDSSVEMLSLAQVGIADREFNVIRVEENGRRIIAEILPGLPVGQQDLRILLENGQATVLEEGFEVTPALELTGFQIDPIGTQVRQRPFSITIRAQGPDAALFRGRVMLRSTKGTVDPPVSGLFEAGVRTQVLSIDDTGGNNVAIIVEDYVNHTATSNEFRLNPNP
jgi:hypothetical protein